MIEFVGSAHQVLAAAQSFVHDDHKCVGVANVSGLAFDLDHLHLLQSNWPKVSGRRTKILYDLFFHHGTEFASADGRRELGFVHLVVAAHQHQQGPAIAFRSGAAPSVTVSVIT